jgi:hypothetical protein
MELLQLGLLLQSGGSLKEPLLSPEGIRWLQLGLPLGGGGILILIALVSVANRRAVKRASARAAELRLVSGRQAQQQLVAEGVDPELAAKGIRQASEEAVITSAAEMLSRGASEKEVREFLAARGLDPEAAADVVHDLAHPAWVRRHPVLSVVLGLPVIALGVGMTFAGLVLRDGNRTGRFVTFPFAGGLTIMAGIGVLSVGLVLTVVPFMKMRQLIDPRKWRRS